VIRDSLGCTKTGTVNLNASSSLPVPLFLACTKNSIGDTIILVDISVPKADSVQWLLPSAADVIGGSMHTPIVAFKDTGTFVVTMRAFYGSCMIPANKTLRVSIHDTLEARSNNVNGIKSFSIYPNPNSGIFTIEGEFYKKQNASVQVWDLSPLVHFQQNFFDAEIFVLPVNLSHLTNGNYVIRLIGEYDARSKPLIISK
jgi:hypothetical protein